MGKDVFYKFMANKPVSPLSRKKAGQTSRVKAMLKRFEQSLKKKDD